MRIVVQRVTRANIAIDSEVTAAIGSGLLLLVGIARGDSRADADYLGGKIAELRIFNDAAGKMNLSLKDTGGAVLVVSNFTLYGDIRKGRRPSFDRAAPPDEAKPLYEYFVERMKSYGFTTATGVFQAQMAVSLENDGPVTLVCDSR